VKHLVLLTNFVIKEGSEICGCRKIFIKNFKSGEIRTKLKTIKTAKKVEKSFRSDYDLVIFILLNI